MKNPTTSKRGNQPGMRPSPNLYQDDARMLAGMGQKYHPADQEVYDAFIDLRELLLRRLGKGT